MTAFDTTNLRLAITVPAHGMVLFRLRCGAITGATKVPTILPGVMNGASVLGRVTPQDFPGTMNATTQSCPCQAEFIVTGLTPGAMNVDAAYGVEVVVASTNIKYGGPNNTTTNDAWGGFAFEAWDPQPQTANSTLAVDASGRVDVGKVGGTAQTAGDIIADTNDVQARLPAALVGGRIDASVGAMAANVMTAAAAAADLTTELQTGLATAAALATVQADTDDIQSRLPAALVAGRMDASVGAMAANVLTAAAVNAAALNGKGDWNIGKTGYALTTAEEDAIVNKVWDELTSEGRTAG